jgi:hypothetical protein
VYKDIYRPHNSSELQDKQIGKRSEVSNEWATWLRVLLRSSAQQGSWFRA